jgi:cytochrome c biogenesis protein CcmG, thiol:disulfide interchange protein DsbE
MSFSRHWNLITTLILIASAAWIWASRASQQTTTHGGIPAPIQGFQAPDFKLDTLQGGSMQLSALRGKPVLVSLWASWCPPCKAEMPAFEKVYRQYGDQGFTILAVNASNQDSQADAQAFVQANDLTFPILLDTQGRVSQLYDLRSLPTSFFIDRDGVIREIVVGGPLSQAGLQIRVERLLKDAH